MFIDAEHTTSFHNWCINNLIEPLNKQRREGTIPVIVHDVFVEDNNDKSPASSAQTIIDWLEDNGIPYFSPSWIFPSFNEINELRQDLSIGLNGSIHPRSEKNSMILFFIGDTTNE